MKWLLIIPVVSLALLVGLPTSGTNFQEGLDAYDRGDFATALEEWTPLVKQGHTGAQTNLGVLYNKGEGVDQDYGAALKWWTLAAEQGHSDAQANLGLLYVHGQGVPADDVYAYMWWNIAASQGNKNARINLIVGKKKLSPLQLQTAQRLALEWIATHQS
jgi:TPR repeat protein